MPSDDIGQAVAKAWEAVMTLPRERVLYIWHYPVARIVEPPVVESLFTSRALRYLLGERPKRIGTFTVIVGGKKYSEPIYA